MEATVDQEGFVQVADGGVVGIGEEVFGLELSVAVVLKEIVIGVLEFSDGGQRNVLQGDGV